MKALCTDARLDISLDEEHGTEWVILTLTSQSGRATIRQEVGNNTTSRIYHRREAIVIAMRQLVSRAIEQQIISVSPGEWKTPKARTVKQESFMSPTDWGF